MKAWGLTPTAWDLLPRGDQAVILAHEANEGERCPSCGHLLDSREPFEVVRHECAGCKQLDKINEKTRNSKTKKLPAGIFHVIRRIVKS